MSEVINHKLKELVSELKRPYSEDVIGFFQNVDAGNARIQAVNFVGAEDPLKMGPPKFEFNYRMAGAPALLVLSTPWLATLEQELFNRGLKVATLEQEAMRGGTLLLSNMRYADIAFGQNYSNNVLLDFIRERFGSIDVVTQILSNMKYSLPPNSGQLHDCRNYVESAINGLGNSLVLQLHYDNQVAFRVLVGAVVYFLDQRFQVSLSKILFPKK